MNPPGNNNIITTQILHLKLLDKNALFFNSFLGNGSKRKNILLTGKKRESFII